MKYFFLFTSLLLLLASCSDTESSVSSDELDAIKIKTRFNRLELKQQEITDVTKANEFMTQYPSFVNLMLKRSLPSREMLGKVLIQMANDPQNKQLLEACASDYKDFSDVELAITNAFKYIKYYYPEFGVKEVNTFSGGLTSGYDIAIHDSSIFIGIDHFLVDKEKFRPNPQVFHNYILKSYSRENIALKISQLLSQSYNAYDKQDQTLLANMIFFGKAYYFVKAVNPAMTDATVMEYDKEEWGAAEQHVHIIWEHFLKRELFYTTDRKIISKYVDPRPKTGEVAEACPGRIGQWLGYKIVQSYMQNNPDISLQDLMAEKNSQKIFQKSKFRPRKN
ncbi:MAG: hypothetical protein GY827_09850 [Cytophagales bacterium]|nr:hypothetical protein [Cytophagales bacterium]